MYEGRRQEHEWVLLPRKVQREPFYFLGIVTLKSVCNLSRSSVDHLFLTCLVAMDLWSMVLGLFGISWVMPHTVLELLWCWQGSFGHHRNGYIWSIVPHGLMWCLWRERNSRCFEDFDIYSGPQAFLF